jgi:hypothetical protein
MYNYASIGSSAFNVQEQHHLPKHLVPRTTGAGRSLFGPGNACIVAGVTDHKKIGAAFWYLPHYLLHSHYYSVPLLHFDSIHLSFLE